MPVVSQRLLQLRDGLLQRHNLLLPLVLLQPVGHFVRAAKHIRAFLLLQLRQCGHQPTHPILHHLFGDRQLLTSRVATYLFMNNLTTSAQMCFFPFPMQIQSAAPWLLPCCVLLTDRSCVYTPGLPTLYFAPEFVLMTYMTYVSCYISQQLKIVTVCAY